MAPRVPQRAVAATALAAAAPVLRPAVPAELLAAADLNSVPDQRAMEAVAGNSALTAAALAATGAVAAAMEAVAGCALVADAIGAVANSALAEPATALAPIQAAAVAVTAVAAGSTGSPIEAVAVEGPAHGPLVRAVASWSVVEPVAVASAAEAVATAPGSKSPDQGLFVGERFATEKAKAAEHLRGSANVSGDTPVDVVWVKVAFRLELTIDLMKGLLKRAITGKATCMGHGTCLIPNTTTHVM